MTQTQVSGSGIKNNVITNNHLHSAANIASSKLANSGVTSGSYGSGSATLSLTINAKGVITAASTNAISIGTSNISNNSVTFAKLVDINVNQIIGRLSSGSGDPEALNPSQIRSIINVEDGATADQTASEILTLIKTVDGTGSGLDADLLDGYSVSNSGGNSVVLATQSNGYLYLDNWLRIAHGTGIFVNGGQHLFSGANGDWKSWYNRSDASQACGIGLQSNGGSDLAWVYANTSQTGFLNPNTETWRFRVETSGITKLNSDGAQLVDGNVAQNLKYIAGANTSDIGISGYNSGGTWKFQLYGATNYYGFLTSNWGSWDIRKNINGQLQVRVGGTLYTVWHNGNDGGSSGLDSDRLDGQEGAHYLDASNLNAGTLPSARIGSATVPSPTSSISIMGNFGQWQAHSTYQDFNTDVAYWGWNFMNNNTNAPNSASPQWYRSRLSLGTGYGIGTASNNYWLEMAIPRYNHTTSGQMYIRSCENGSIGSWTEVGSRPRNHVIPYANNSIDLGSTTVRWRNVYTNDLNLSNEGSSNDVDGTWGSYTIQEGAESLFLINKRNGKKYKFNLTEVS